MEKVFHVYILAGKSGVLYNAYTNFLTLVERFKQIEVKRHGSTHYRRGGTTNFAFEGEIREKHSRHNLM